MAANPTGVGGHEYGYAKTTRTDKWWVGPAATAFGLGLWLIYYVWSAAQGDYYAAGPYMSPFYPFYLHPSEAGMGASDAFFGMNPAWWPALISPALIAGFAPGAFRITCYYYRKAYYRAFFGTPPGCAVGARPQDYRGETFLLVFQNLHRYALYGALLLLPYLYWEAFQSFRYHGEWGVGVGSIVMVLNSVFLTFYTLGCHAWRHLVGGQLNCFSCGAVPRLRYGAWKGVSRLNENHMKWAWTSLIWIAFTDIYIRLVSMGVITDLNTWGGF
ncbi:MAG: succinate dehydrogenase [Proteobacteria bacterium]|nr:succinate dehydrogenase [Pseudomonadota bacterium]